MTSADAAASKAAVVDLTADGDRGVEEEALNLPERYQLLFGSGHKLSPRNSGQSEQRTTGDTRGQRSERGGRGHPLAEEHLMETSGNGETDEEEASKSNDSNLRNELCESGWTPSACNPLPSEDTAEHYVRRSRSKHFPTEEGDAAAVSDNVVDLTTEESDDGSGDSDNDGVSETGATNSTKLNKGENEEEDVAKSTGTELPATKRQKRGSHRCTLREISRRDDTSQPDLTGTTKEGEEQSEDGNYNFCHVCEDGGDLVLCDYCPKAFHRECHVPQLPEKLPSGRWKCCECRASERVHRSRCGTCAACRRQDCRKCQYCQDMIKYGGPGRQKQACKERQCMHKRFAPPEAVATVRTASACGGDSGVICRDDVPLMRNNDNGSCESSSDECDDDDSMQVQSYQDSASIPRCTTDDDDGTSIDSTASRFSRESITGVAPCADVDREKIGEELAESPARRKSSRSTAFRGAMREPSSSIADLLESVTPAKGKRKQRRGTSAQHSSLEQKESEEESPEDGVPSLLNEQDNGFEGSSDDYYDGDSMKVQWDQKLASNPRCTACDDAGASVDSETGRFSRESATSILTCANINAAEVEEKPAEVLALRKSSRSTAFRGAMKEPSDSIADLLEPVPPAKDRGRQRQQRRQQRREGNCMLHSFLEQKESEEEATEKEKGEREEEESSEEEYSEEESSEEESSEEEEHDYNNSCTSLAKKSPRRKARAITSCLEGSKKNDYDACHKINGTHRWYRFLLLKIANSMSDMQCGCGLSNHAVYAAGVIIETDAKGKERSLLDSSQFNRKGMKELHAEELLLRDLKSRYFSVEQHSQQGASRHMVLMVIHNMSKRSGSVSGSLCGDCVCALQSFHRDLRLDHRKLKVVVPQLVSDNGKKTLQPLRTVTKLARALQEENTIEESRILDCAEFAPCVLNEWCTGTADVGRSVEEIVQKSFIAVRSSPHLPCCWHEKDHWHQCVSDSKTAKLRSMNLPCSCQLIDL